MTENPTESDQVQSEPGETPTPRVPSAGTDAQQTSAGGQIDRDALVKDISENVINALKDGVLPGLAEQAIQSTKDKRFRPLADLGEEGVQALKSFKRYLDKYNGDEEEAIRQMRLDAAISQGSAQPGPVRGGTGSGVEARMERFARRILGTAELAMDDPRYEEWLNGYNFVSEEGFYDDLEAQMQTWKNQTAKQTQAAGPAAVAPASSGDYALSDDADELAARLERLQHPQPGEPGLTHPDNIKERAAIREKLKKVTPQQTIGPRVTTAR